MGKQFKREELLENLPDFINGKIQDEELIIAINLEISADSDFKKEFDLLSSTLEGINSITFSEPPEFYFNNLLPEINEKIYAESKSSKFIKKFSTIWKLALPVSAVLLIFIGYKTFFNNNEIINGINNDTQVVINNDFQNKIKNDDSALMPDDKITSTEQENTKEAGDVINEFTKSFYSKSNISEYSSKPGKEENNVTIDLSDNTTDDDVFFSNDDEPNIEQEFEKLNPDEQNKILNEIKNSKL
jgi:hypothetical protein